MRSAPTAVVKDIGAIAVSVALAVLLAKTGAITSLLAAVGDLRFLGAFAAGMFFVSVFTVAPAAAVLIGLFQAGPVVETALAGAVGGLVGDWILFRFFRDRMAADIAFLLRRAGGRRLPAILHLRSVRWLSPLLGAVIIASPFPDEIGLALMGLAGLRTILFLPLSFGLNFLGILALGLAVRAAG